MNVSEDAKNEIIERLYKIQNDEEVKILWAAESGSRAWGFPSKDSDYDVRFVYCRKQAWYLTIDAELKRDVIELPIVDDYDINGWDIKKALNLFRKSNPPLMEWLLSPIIYLDVGNFAHDLRKLGPVYYSTKSLFHHYMNIAEKQDIRNLRKKQVKFKAYFYTLRSLLACKWIEQGYGVPPMEFAPLVKKLIDDQVVLDEIEKLITKKVKEPELGYGDPIEALSDYIESEFKRLQDANIEKPTSLPNMNALNQIFKTAIDW